MESIVGIGRRLRHSETGGRDESPNFTRSYPVCVGDWGNPRNLNTTINVAYGSDPRQMMDVYAPINMTDDTKLAVLLHGGGWSKGRKEDMKAMVFDVSLEFSNVVIANMNYRLGTPQDPGHKKQLDDIKLALKHLREKVFKKEKVNTALIGASAGGHLAMLYGYKLGHQENVMAIVNVLGPADFADPSIAYSPHINILVQSFVGPYTYCQNPEIYKAWSPSTHVSDKSPPTVAFFGLNDTIVPPQQGEVLKKKLEEAGVKHEVWTYPGGHFYDWKAEHKFALTEKCNKFLHAHW